MNAKSPDKPTGLSSLPASFYQELLNTDPPACITSGICNGCKQCNHEKSDPDLNSFINTTY